MLLRRLLLPIPIVLAAAAGCYTGSVVEAHPGPSPSASTSIDDTDPAPAAEATTDHAGSPLAGLPCDVEELLTTSCAECHGARPTAGAPNRLMTYDDLAARSASDPERTVAELSVARMRSSRQPMPPAGNLDAELVAILGDWIAAGMPRGACGKANDAGATTAAADGGIRTEPDKPTSVCTSGSLAHPDAPPSMTMKPGNACLSCHSSIPGRTFALAGTVYPTLHEPNDCAGVAGVKVLIIDAHGATYTMTTNTAGNFYRYTPIALPYRAMVIRGTDVREMKTLQTSGDCNDCHTEWGVRSPGRVMAP